MSNKTETHLKVNINSILPIYHNYDQLFAISYKKELKKIRLSVMIIYEKTLPKNQRILSTIRNLQVILQSSIHISNSTINKKYQNLMEAIFNSNQITFSLVIALPAFKLISVLYECE